VAAAGITTGAQISINIGTTEGVNRLFRVADQDQTLLRRIFRHTVNGVENTVLQRIGILKFVDHRHRELRTDDLRQPRAVVTAERSVQTGQQIVETHLRALLLLEVKTIFYPAAGMLQ